MHSRPDCLHCYLKQAVTVMNIAGTKEEKQREILYELMGMIPQLDYRLSPAENSSIILLKTYELIGSDDPYVELKREINHMAMEIFPRLESVVENAEDTLYQALKLSAAGNVIDVGFERDYDIDAAIKHSIEADFHQDDYLLFKKMLSKTDSVLIIGDNAGEIVLDKLVVSELVKMNKKVTYMVRGSAILNDATIDDAIMVGMDNIADVIDNGSSFMGVIPSRMSEQAIKAINKSSLIIAKGQANFETMESLPLTKGKSFLLLKMKCHEVSTIAGSPQGQAVFIHR